MGRDEFEQGPAAIDEANAALEAHVDTVQDAMFGSAEAGTTRWLAECDRLVRIRDLAEADLAAHL
jgi:hypothetical protein